MIDTTIETIRPLSHAARRVPSRSGRGVNVSTIWRWGQRGVKGIRLETLLIGGIRYTSDEALHRFFAETTAAANGDSPPVQTNTQRERAIAAADRELARAGI